MIEPGDPVILAGAGKNLLLRAGTGKTGTDLGLINLDDLVGKEPGDIIATHSGKELCIRIPRPSDYFEQVKRTGAPMLPRDIGLVIGMTGMNQRDRVLDAGTGSGVASIYFAGVAAHVTSYEKREEFHEAARVNIESAGVKNITLISGDMRDASGVFEVVHLDLLLTRDHVLHAHRLLSPGGYLACYTPFFEQMALAYDTAAEVFSEVGSHECIMREMDRSDRGTRPSTRVCHSGYITVARK